MAIAKDWLTSFQKVFFRPTPAIMIEESRKAKGKFSSAVLLLFLVGIYSLIILKYINDAQIKALAALAASLIFPVVLLFYVFCIHLIYRRVFRGSKDVYNEILYLFVSILIPYTVVCTILALIPGVGSFLSGILTVYFALLITISIYSICKIKVWESVATFILATIIGSVGLFCIPAFFLSIIGTVPRIF